MDMQYSMCLAHQALQHGSSAMHRAKLIWQTWAPLKQRLSCLSSSRFTSAIGQLTEESSMTCKLPASPTCHLCNQEDETMEHIPMYPLILHATCVTPVFPKKTKCKRICMLGSSFMHIVTYK
jgi:hypothetical protein